ncbi:hypothetical protein, partial [Aeromonas sp. HMWF014]|uniref:hypothetical protein n=1 Tax=Aeromonas sp. HMWF014 TaxID=2056850 RepID=UPI001C62E65F
MVLDQDPCLSRPKIRDPDCEQVRLLKDPPRIIYPQEWHTICPAIAAKIAAVSHFFVTTPPLSPHCASYPRFLWITVCNSMSKPLDNYSKPGSCVEKIGTIKTNSLKIIMISNK